MYDTVPKNEITFSSRKIKTESSSTLVQIYTKRGQPSFFLFFFLCTTFQAVSAQWRSQNTVSAAAMQSTSLVTRLLFTTDVVVVVGIMRSGNETSNQRVCCRWIWIARHESKRATYTYKSYERNIYRARVTMDLLDPESALFLLHVLSH